ncbi:MAG: cation-translocating P-type ATPase [Clostridiales bacterium]|nr:cation-translocating P-type ATPase [Clostridiales bacterium]MCF8021831.1 cation-translocating P-type ATPase [Clostridiales bacterium]
MKAIHNTSPEVVHNLPERIRIKIPGLNKNIVLLSHLINKLSSLNGITDVKGSINSGRMLIHYNKDLISYDLIINEINYLCLSTNDTAVSKNEKEHVEKEYGDLPIRRELFNVTLGGTILAGFTVKRLIAGPSSLSRSTSLSYIANATTLISGYPIIRSGITALTRKKQINHDLIISITSLITILLRENISGLLVIWLSNLGSLLQSILVKQTRDIAEEYADNTIENVKFSSKPISTFNSKNRRIAASPLEKEAENYAQKITPVYFGLAGLAGLAARNFEKSLAMLIAASPGPLQLYRSSSISSGMALAAKHGILVHNRKSLEVLEHVDTLIFTEQEMFDPGLEIGKIIPLQGYTEEDVLTIAASLFKKAGHALNEAFSSSIQVQNLEHVTVKDITSSGICGEIYSKEVLIGDYRYISSKIDLCDFNFYKAERLKHHYQCPYYIYQEGELIGLIGIKSSVSNQAKETIYNIRTRGIKSIYVMNKDNNESTSIIAKELGLHTVKSNEEMLDEMSLLHKNNNYVGLIANNLDDITNLSNITDVNILLKTEKTLSKLNSKTDIIVDNGIKNLPTAFKVSFHVGETTRQSFALSGGFNSFGLALAASSLISPLGAGLFNNVTSILITVHSLKLLKKLSNNTHKYYDNLAVKQYAAASDNTNDESIYTKPWAMMSREKVIDILNSSGSTGLDLQEVNSRLTLYGKNMLAEPPPPSFFSRVLAQLKDFLIYVLVGSSVVCLLLGEKGDALAIISIVIINAVLSAVQEHKAEGSLSALKKMTTSTAAVIRDGREQSIPAVELVPGDIIIIEQGNIVPADTRLIESNALEVEESALTGESYPVPKKISTENNCMYLLDCHNLTFMGTIITKGHGKGIVVGTGMDTELGHIAQMLNNNDNETTPLQKRLADLGKTILKGSTVVSGIVVIAGLMRGGSLLQMLITGVSLAVAAIPEGLPAIVTLALASGVHKMASANTIVRKLPAVETLGCATMICTDKTGTLTQNQQTIKLVYCGQNEWWSIEGDGYNPENGFIKPANGQDIHNQDNIYFTLCAAAQCCTSKIVKNDNEWEVKGDPTEGAILTAAGRAGINLNNLNEEYMPVREIPFDSEKCKMTQICRGPKNQYIAFTKGAPEVILENCTHYRAENNKNLLDNEYYQSIVEANNYMTTRGMRVLGVAYKILPEAFENNVEKNEETEQVFLGLIGMTDPPRPEVTHALNKCKQAGIGVAMITGDHKQTAFAIGSELGLVNSSNEVLTGKEIDEMDENDLINVIHKVRVFARLYPNQKVLIINTFKQQGHIVGMIGDGINDAPAVKEADIGIAMGKSGTDVTKQAAQIIITDDYFGTAVTAVEQGRGIYENIKKSIRYLLATNVGEIILMFTAVAGGLPLPLLPIQLLWLNMLGDGLPALALSIDKFPPDLIKQPPRDKDEAFIDKKTRNQIISRGLTIGITGIGAYMWGLNRYNLSTARSMTLSSITLSQLLHVLDCRKNKDNKTSSNLYVGSAVASSAGLLFSAIHLPAGQRIFGTCSLDPSQWGVVFVSSIMSQGLDILNK